MAQPAWVVRTRRTRSRPRSAPGRRSGWRARVLRNDQIRRAERIWLALLFGSLFVRTPSFVRSTRVNQAALSARAVFEGTPFVAPESSLNGATELAARLKLGDFRRISLRYAAHLVTVSVVLTIVLVSALQLPAETRLLAVQTSDSRGGRQGLADLQVQRIMSFTPEVNDSLFLLPASQPLPDQAAPAFVDSHLVVEGETLEEIAAQYQVSVASLFWSNDLQTGNVFAAGQELRVPRVSGVPHIIEEGETLESIAEQLHVQPEAIVLFKANGVSEDGPLPIGRELFIPGGTLPYPPEITAQYGGEQGIATMRASAAGTVQESDTNLRAGPGREYPRLGYLDAGRRLKLIARHDTWVKVESGADAVGWVRADLLGLDQVALTELPETNDFPPPPPRWVWPTRGEITSSFGWRSAPFRGFHDGLDIANRAWTEIHAARTGQVYEAGWCSGFGYCVKIDHGDGMTTIYGHLIKRPPVKVGDMVDAGEVIGYMGSTYDRRGGGYSTGVHLHFTVKLNGKAVNPLKFLP